MSLNKCEGLFKQCTNQAAPEYEVDLKSDESNGTLFFASETVFLQQWMIRYETPKLSRYDFKFPERQFAFSRYFYYVHLELRGRKASFVLHM